MVSIREESVRGNGLVFLAWNSCSKNKNEVIFRKIKESLSDLRRNRRESCYQLDGITAFYSSHVTWYVRSSSLLYRSHNYPCWLFLCWESSRHHVATWTISDFKIPFSFFPLVLFKKKTNKMYALNYFCPKDYNDCRGRNRLDRKWFLLMASFSYSLAFHHVSVKPGYDPLPLNTFFFIRMKNWRERLLKPMRKLWAQ